MWPGRCPCCPTSTRGLPRTPTTQGAALRGRLCLAQRALARFSRRKPLWLRDNSLRSRVAHLHGCTPTRYAQQQGGPALFSNFHHLYQCCCRPAGGGKSGGPPAAPPPCTPAESSRDFRSRYSGTDGLLWLGTLGVFGALRRSGPWLAEALAKHSLRGVRLLCLGEALQVRSGWAEGFAGGPLSCWGDPHGPHARVQFCSSCSKSFVRL